LASNLRAQSRLGQRHHLYSDGAWLSVSGGDYLLGEPCGSGLSHVEHDGHGLLYRGARRSAGAARFNTDKGAQFTSAAFTGGLELTLKSDLSQLEWCLDAKRNVQNGSESEYLAASITSPLVLKQPT
jgi:hypothetical protein